MVVTTTFKLICDFAALLIRGWIPPQILVIIMIFINLLDVKDKHAYNYKCFFSIEEIDSNLSFNTASIFIIKFMQEIENQFLKKDF